MDDKDLREGETLELKECWTPRALEDLAAFANQSGGTLLLGVQDDGEVLGFEGNDADLQRIASQIVDSLGLMPSLSVQEYSGKSVLKIHVVPATIPIPFKGRYLTRVGSTNRDMTPEQIARRLMARLGQSWDSLLSTKSLDDANEQTVRQFLQLARQRLSHLSENEPTYRLLDNLNLLDNDRLTNAGVLLFGAQPQRVFPAAQIHLGQFRNQVIVDDRTLQGDLFSLLKTVMERLQSYLTVRLDVAASGASLKDLQRHETWEYPLDALREAVINALIHRDYAALGEIQIRVHEDRLDIWNPGSLPEGISIEDLRREGHVSKLRNPLLAQTFYYAGLVERWGTGTTRMIAVCHAHGLPEPQFREESDGFKVTFLKDLYSAERLGKLGLNKRQIQAVLYVKENGSIGNMEYQKLTGASKPTATRDLKDLQQRGVLLLRGTGRTVHYVLKDSKTAQRDH
jgi:ATP-dependent DNA helicase RecG